MGDIRFTKNDRQAIIDGYLNEQGGTLMFRPSSLVG